MDRLIKSLSICVLILLGFQSKSAANQDSSCEVIQRGEASWYGPGLHGNRTASGEPFNMYDFTAASPTIPFGTVIRVTNRQNGLSVVVRVNDFGPFEGDRILDLSMAAADAIGLLRTGTGPVNIATCDAWEGNVRTEELLTSPRPYPRPDEFSAAPVEQTEELVTSPRPQARPPYFVEPPRPRQW